MRKIIALTVTLLCTVSFMYAQKVKFRMVSTTEAVNIVKQSYTDASVDYYTASVYYTNGTVSNIPTPLPPGQSPVLLGNRYWLVFVDEYPNKGWEHPCKQFIIPQSVIGNNPVAITDSMSVTIPPAGINLNAFEINNVYGNNATHKPNLPVSNIVNNVANKTYAIILNGGYNKVANMEQAWNDCSYMYQTLTNTYHVPASNIYSFISDGTNTDADMRKADGSGFMSSSASLNGVSDAPNYYAATSANIRQVINTLSSQLNQDDHLFLYITGPNGKRSVYLWNEDSLRMDSLAHWLSNIACYKTALTDNYFNSQYINSLRNNTQILLYKNHNGATSYREDLPYGDFVYNWLNALNRCDLRGDSILADDDEDGYVSFEEAFYYANPLVDTNTRMSISADNWWHPNMYSFNDLLKDVDLFVKDGYGDVGRSPNLADNVYWDSPYLYLRRNDDGQNMDCSDQESLIAGESEVGHIYTHLYNRGLNMYNQNEGRRYLHLYCAEATLGLTTDVFRGIRTNAPSQPLGNRIASFPIRVDLNPLGHTILCKHWDCTDILSNYEDGDTVQFALLARIGNDNLDDNNTFNFNEENMVVARDSSNYVMKNRLFVRNAIMQTPLRVFNAKPQSSGYDIAFFESNDKPLFDDVEVYITLGNTIYTAWTSGGSHSTNMTQDPEYMQRLKVNGNGSSIENLQIGGYAAGMTTVNFVRKNNNPIDGVLHLAMIDNTTGEVVNGMAIEVADDSLSGSRLNGINHSVYIKSASYDKNASKICVSLSEPLPEDQMLRVSSIGANVTTTLHELVKGTSEITVNGLDGNATLYSVTLVKDGKGVSTKKVLNK